MVTPLAVVCYERHSADRADGGCAFDSVVVLPAVDGAGRVDVSVRRGARDRGLPLRPFEDCLSDEHVADPSVTVLPKGY